MDKNKFNQIKNRKNSNSIKWDLGVKQGFDDDVIPLWVADTDFETDDAVIDALKEKVEHKLFGYHLSNDDYKDAVAFWCLSRHDTIIDSQTILSTPGVVSAIAASILALTKPQDAILIFEPVYHPFRKMIQINQRDVVVSELVCDQHNHYSIDFDDAEQKIVQHHVKMMIFCSPHNPVGRVWTPQELHQIARISQKHNVILISDEIHMDFVFKPNKHQMLIGLDDAYKQFVITLISASKTFNLADTKTSQAIIYNDDFYKRIAFEFEKVGIMSTSGWGQIAQQAAYTHGARYVDQMNQHIETNKQLVIDLLQKHKSKIKVTDNEGLYLLWLDFRAYEKNHQDMMNLLLHDAKVWLHNGSVFGNSGQGFFRMNIATSTELVRKATLQIIDVFNQL
jgi:cystathionine beta-lyase